MAEEETAGPSKRPRLSSERAGLSFPVERIAKLLTDCTFFDQVGYAAPIYLAAVLEYISFEVLELAASRAINDKMNRIVPRHIQFSIWNDDELLKLLGKVTLFRSRRPLDIYTLFDSTRASSSGTKDDDDQK